MAKLNVNGTVHTVEVEPDTPLLWVHPRAARPDRHEVRLRHRPVRRLHRAYRRRRDALLLAAGRAPSRRARRSSPSRACRRTAQHPVQKAWVALDVPQCGYCQSGMIMAAAALLARDAEADRRRHRRRDHQHLPLRHLQPRPRRDQARRRGRPRRGAADGRRIMTTCATGLPPPFLVGSAAAGRRALARLPRPVRRRRRRAGAPRRPRSTPGWSITPRRHRGRSASRAPRWGRARSPASPSSSPRSSNATGRRSRPNIRRPARTSRATASGADFSTGGSRGIRESHEYVRKGGAAARDDADRRPRPTNGSVPAAECTRREERHHARRRPAAPRPTARSRTRPRKLEPPKDVTLKDPKDWKIAGKPLKRLDTADKVDRQAGLRHRPQAAGHAQRRDQGLPGLRRQGEELRRRQGRRACRA